MFPKNISDKLWVQSVISKLVIYMENNPKYEAMHSTGVLFLPKMYGVRDIASRAMCIVLLYETSVWQVMCLAGVVLVCKIDG